jgi:hypothetical protein
MTMTRGGRAVTTGMLRPTLIRSDRAAIPPRGRSSQDGKCPGTCIFLGAVSTLGGRERPLVPREVSTGMVATATVP